MKVAIDHAGHIRDFECVEVFRIVVSIGRGSDDDPCRLATEWRLKDGRLLLREDDWKAARESQSGGVG